jgi:tripartite-type tricarboxylate transporter receptor subunit TctC
MTQKAIAAAFLVLALVAPTSAQEWPTKPVTMVVPFAAGGPVDLVGRLFAPRLSEILGQQVIIENVGGAGGSTGALRVAKAAPDGYTFLLGNSGTHTYNQLLTKRPIYDAVADFAPVAVIVENSKLLVTRKDFPADTLQEFIAYAKANRSKMSFGSAGTGSATHMTCVLLNSAIGVEITHIPYRATTQAMQDILAGRVDYVCDVVQTSLELIRSHSVKALALLSPTRARVLPDLKTADEQGLKDFDADAWNAFFFPKGTPAQIVARLAKATSDILDAPAMRERLEPIGLNVPRPERRNPAFLGKLLVSELDKWAAPVKASGATLE